jgi:tape measure domain-containing protein
MAGFNLGDIFVTFKAKTEDVQQGVAKVKEKIGDAQQSVSKFNFKSFAQNASSAFGGVANMIQGVATKLFYLATASSVGLGAFVKSAADLQQTSKSFEVLTGNVEVANKLFAQLAKYANTTPFEFPDIAKAGQILLGFGIKSEDVYKRITMLGDIAAATGADFQSLALVFGQVNATGKLMGQDALQLINNKIPITGILAKKLGVSVQEVKQRMEEGTISADLFNQALEEQTKKGGFAFHGTAILAESLNGRLSTLKDTVLEFGRNLIGVKVDPELGLVIKPGGIFDRFSKLVPKITDSLAKLGPKAAKAFEWIVAHGDTVKAVLIGIGAAFVAAKVAAIGFAIAANLNPFTAIATAIVILIGALAALQAKYDWIGKTLAFIQPYWQALVDIFNTYIMPSMIALGNTIMQNLWPALQQLWDAVVRLWNALNPALMTAIKIIAGIMGALWVAQIWLVINVFNVMINVISGVISFISNLIKWISNLIGWLGNIPGAAVKAYQAVTGWFGKLPGYIGGIVNAVVQWFKDLPGRIGGAIGGIVGVLTGPFKSAFNAIADFWNRTVGNVSFKAPDWVPGIGGKGWSIPKMPHLAMGTPNFRGGMVSMNEFGPETAVLPPGTRVLTAEQTRRGEQGGGDTYHIHLQGVMARSESELADIIEGGIKALDRRRAGAGKPQILGATG